MGLASNTLYGANLSSTTVEMLGQRYNTVTASNNSYVAYQQYAYTNTAVMATFNDIWTQAYASITKTNNRANMASSARFKLCISDSSK